MTAGLHLYSITMAKDGTTERIYMAGFAPVPHAELCVWNRARATAYVGKPVQDAVRGKVWAKDEKHAIKITNEYRTQQIALGNMEERVF